MERYDAKDTYHAWYEHWHRYHWLSPFLNNQTIADLACGEGYGSALLAQHAHQVTGIDIDSDTIEQARTKYKKSNNLEYIKANVLKTPLADGSMDVVTSFETLEHLTEHQQLLTEFKRILKPGGTLVISTPDKDVYSGSETHNEFHLKELSQAEFKELISTHFEHVVYFGQQFQTSSVLAPLAGNSGNNESIYVEQHNEFTKGLNQQKPTYLIAVASDSAESILPFKKAGTSHFNDCNNKLFNHYEQQIKRLLEADQQLKKLETQIEIQNQVINQLKARLGL